MSKIEIIGLGAGDLDQLPFGVYKKLIQAPGPVLTRTIDHPVITELQKEEVSFASFDHLYEEEEGFAAVYERIVAELIHQAKKDSETILYAVPGHPMLAEKTTQLLLAQTEVEISLLGGQSYLDDLFTAMKIDPIEGFQFVDGTDLHRDQLNLKNHLFICQVYDAFIASEVKLTLLEDLPAEFEVYIVEAAGSVNEQIVKVTLEELDQKMWTSNLISVYVPPVPDELLHHTFSHFRQVMQTLRGPDGCPWDKKQTHESLRYHTIEEVYELIDAIDAEDDDNIIEELGDLLMHVLLHSQIGEDNGYFSIDDVILSITNKMIHRHPHVFSNQNVEDANQVEKNWEELKREEKGHQRELLLDGIPNHLPSLSAAYKITKKAAKVGFEWEDVEGVWDKLYEEIEEVKEAVREKKADEVEDEIGDVLFVLANLSRYYNVHPEIALNRANNKFKYRFGYIEDKLLENNLSFENVSLEQMDDYWNEAKQMKKEEENK